MKNWLKFAAALLIGVFIFTACDDEEEEIFLNVPADATLDLGAEGFDPMEGVSVSGTDIENVSYTVMPDWNEFQVDHYVFTYSAGADASADRNVYIQVDNLLGNYTVTDVDDDGTTYNPYLVTVLKGNEFNELRFSELFFNDIIVNAVVNGPAITIPSQDFTIGGSTVTIEGTGTYDGEAGDILTIDYNIDGVFGTSTFE